MTMPATVTKTWKLFIGGAFPRTESGRTIKAVAGGTVHHLCKASRKDLRDAVESARAAQAKWAASTAYLRGQVLYRLAEMMQARHGEFVDAIRATARITPRKARDEVDAAIEHVVCFAGWTDKIAIVLGSQNPVAGPFYTFSGIEPTGVVAVLAPDASPLLGALALACPALAAGNAVVLVASERHPIPALVLAEALATSDLPGGVCNVLTGDHGELAPAMAGHRDIDAIVAAASGKRATALKEGVAENMKRVQVVDPDSDFTDARWRSPAVFRGVTECKTVWMPAMA
jgi:acyl-CoA reductase-like NAD-dependent aldehyde dehydrogenase